MIIHKMEQGSEAWHAERLGRFTGSKAKDLLSKKTTAAYQNLIASIAAEILTGEKEDSYVSFDMQRGTDLEPQARKYYAEMFDLKIQEVGFIQSEHEIYGDYCGISPDGLIGKDGMIEIKCPKANTMFKYFKADKLPPEYVPQVQMQLMISERDWCDFMAYYPNLKPFLIRVFPDLDYFKTLETELIEGVKNVKELIKNYQNYGR